MILLGPAGGRGNSDMSFCLARGVVKCVRPLWTTLPMEDGDEVPETIEPPPPGICLSQVMVFKKFCSGTGAGISESNTGGDSIRAQRRLSWKDKQA